MNETIFKLSYKVGEAETSIVCYLKSLTDAKIKMDGFLAKDWNLDKVSRDYVFHNWLTPPLGGSSHDGTLSVWHAREVRAPNGTLIHDMCIMKITLGVVFLEG